MSKYNTYARRLDTAFKSARHEYTELWNSMKAAEKEMEKYSSGTHERQRAEINYVGAKQAFKKADKQIWRMFNKTRAQLKDELENEVRVDNVVDPNAVDSNALKLLEIDILSVDDYNTLVSKYNSNPTMLRLMAKYIKIAADNMDNATERGEMYLLARKCEKSTTLRDWEALSNVADYCSGQTAGRQSSPTHIVGMARRWEELVSQAIENF